MVANPISDSGMARRPFLCPGRHGASDNEHHHHHTDASQREPVEDALHRLSPLLGGGRQQSLRAGTRHVDQAALRTLQQLERQRSLLQELAPATSEAHRRTQTLQLQTTEQSSQSG